MGKLVSINTDNIKPSQDYLKEDTVKFILTCFYENRKDMLPPAPIVRYDTENNEYIAIDGHNLIAVCDLLGENIQVYIAEDEKDELTEEMFPKSTEEGLANRNQELKEKYKNVIEEHSKLSLSELNSFSDLRNKYPYLVSEESAKEFYYQHREKFIKNYLFHTTNDIRLR